MIDSDLVYKATRRIEMSGESREKCDNLTRAFIAYINNDFSSKKVVESGVCSSASFYRYRHHPAFIEAINELRPLIVGRSLERVLAISAEADCDSTSLKASCYLLEAYDPDTYDPGVRRQRIANSATDWLAQLIGNQKLPVEIINEAIEEDPFKELPAATVIPDKSTS